jgi:hypothetical protein
VIHWKATQKNRLDETGIEDILIEKIKNDAEAKIKIICNNMQLS